MPDYVATQDIAYNWMIVAYFFLGGLGAGAFLFSVAANYWKEDLKPAAKATSVITPLAIALGLFLLWIDLGQPFRAWRLFLSFNPTSALSWGVWFLNIFFVLSLIYAWFNVRGQAAKAKRFGYAGLPFAVLVGGYTGILLGQAPGRALWHSALIPVLFINGELILGVAAAVLLSVGRQRGELLSKLGRILAWLVLLELGFHVIELLALYNGEAKGVEAAHALLFGSYSALFLGVEIVLGAVVPLVILFRSKANAAAITVASALAICGILAMRYIVVVGGQTIN